MPCVRLGLIAQMKSLIKKIINLQTSIKKGIN
jgi:hypothetical protein